MQFADHIQNYMQERFFFIISALKLRLTLDNLGVFIISLYNSFMKERGFEIVTGIRKVKFISTKIIQLVLNRIHRRSSQFS